MRTADNIQKIYLTPADQTGTRLQTTGVFDETDQLLKDVAAYFDKVNAYITFNGRSAIATLLQHLQLNSNDEVYITTTFEYPNISSCVTCTVFNFCKPSRVFTDNTKAIFIIHEFGVPHPKTFELIELASQKNIPVIEDCAHSVNSYFNNGSRIGSVGDWTIVSFSKIFPLHDGGLLVGNDKIDLDDMSITLANPLGMYWTTIPDITRKRVALFNLYMAALTNCKYEMPDYPVKNIMPWFFPIKVKEPSKIISLLRTNGIECGLWHGTNIVVLPLHQYLIADDVHYICNILVNESLAHSC